MPRLLLATVVCLCSVAAGCALPAAGQSDAYDKVYRPPGVAYKVLQTPHFDVIFEQGYLDDARETAAILERNYEPTRALVGHRRRLRMPVVLNGFNDRGNGYVTPVPFKQEIELVGIKGMALSPRFDSWLQTVVPHELTHALQADYGTRFGVVGVVRWFSPDGARAMNLALPPGVNEGVAVYRESRIVPGAGRLHHPFFTMQFRAAALSGRPWSLAQMLERPAYARPFNRYYIGGAHLVEYLAAEYGPGFFTRAMRLHYFSFIQGFGVDLWYATGTPPWALGRRFRTAMQARERERLGARGALTQPTVLGSAVGLVNRRPLWIDDRTLVAYVSGYNVRPGFYLIDAEDGERIPLSYQGVTEDYAFSLSPDRGRLYFARYVADPLVTIKDVADLYELDLDARNVKRLTKGERLLAPVTTGEGALWALHNEGPGNNWVAVSGEGVPSPLTSYERARFVGIAPAPGGGPVAVVANFGGRQGIFKATFDHGNPELTPWVGFEDGSVYDCSWSADGRYLLFSADPGDALNVYAYDVANGRVLKLTNAPFGALEPSLSPDGTTLAYINYEHERFELVRLPFRPQAAEEVEVDAGWFVGAVPPGEAHGSPGDSLSPQVQPYRLVRYLRPRLFYPTVRFQDETGNPVETTLGLGLGVKAEGADPLQSLVYAAEGFVQKQELWGSVGVGLGASFLRPVLRVFKRPSTVIARVEDEMGNVSALRVGRAERGGGIRLSTPIIIDANVYRTQAILALEADYLEEKFFDDEGETLLDYQGRFTLTPSAVLALRLQSNIRDLMPNSGVVLRGTSVLDVLDVAGGSIPRRALLAGLAMYVPWFSAFNTGLRLDAGVLTQNRGSVYNLDRFLPRGWEDTFLGEGTFVRLGVETGHPLWYIDNGFLIAPLYFKALYAYGFAETIRGTEAQAERYSSLGGGLALQFRFFYSIDLEFRLGVSYRIDHPDEPFSAVFR